MPDSVISTNLSTMFVVTVKDVDAGETTDIQFRIGDKSGSDAEVCFDGKTWIPAATVHHCMKAFEDRFPLAFE